MSVEVIEEYRQMAIDAQALAASYGQIINALLLTTGGKAKINEDTIREAADYYVRVRGTKDGGAKLTIHKVEEEVDDE